MVYTPCNTEKLHVSTLSYRLPSSGQLVPGIRRNKTHGKLSNTCQVFRP